jgi:spectinomycin phosphotransferase
MRAVLEDVEESAIVSALDEGWGFDVESTEYVAVGGGSYHWVMSARDGTRGFVTVDDLDGKIWLGDTRESVLEGLERAFDTARALREHGLPFVVAPFPAARGETVRRLGPRYTLALFPFVDGEPGRYGEYNVAERTAVFDMLARLHASTPAVDSTAARIGLQIPGRHHLEAALRGLDQTWVGGPFSEPARAGLARHASTVVELLGLADSLSADVERRGAGWVITHGEPHAANVMRTAGGYVLVDWDTVALAPPKRDLWMVAGDAADGSEAYTRTTGHQLDDVAVDFFRLTWDLKDLAEYLSLLRSPHRRTSDTTHAVEFVRQCASIRDPWATFLD